jgi:hypothetical protein
MPRSRARSASPRGHGKVGELGAGEPELLLGAGLGDGLPDVGVLVGVGLVLGDTADDGELTRGDGRCEC